MLAANGALFDDLVPDMLGLVGVWEYFIGNTDWSIAAQHNTMLLQDTTGRILPVAYDFDWSGAVDARYAFPDPRFKMNSVTTRLYRGDCRDEKGYAPVLARFTEKRAAIDSIFATIPQLTPEKVKKMRGYFDEFWKLAANPKQAAREFKDGCQQRGNSGAAFSRSQSPAMRCRVRDPFGWRRAEAAIAACVRRPRWYEEAEIERAADHVLGRIDDVDPPHIADAPHRADSGPCRSASSMS